MKVIERAIQTFGKESQVMVAIEEMSELTKELSKDHRGFDNLNQIAEEIADVEIMLDQLKLIFRCQLLVDFYHRQKLERLEERLEGSNEKEERS